jgi:hypothetical protein
MRRDAERMTCRLCEERSDEAIQGRPGLLRFARNDGLALAVRLFLAVVAQPAIAAPRSIADCERIQDPDAYNRCLASFGPTRGQHGASYPGVASEGGHGGSGRSASRTQSRFGRAQVSQGRGGRMRMEFTPGRR